MTIVVRVVWAMIAASATAALGSWLWLTAPPEGLTRAQNAVLQAEMRRVLIDYESARFEYSSSHRLVDAGAPVFCFWVNAKNRYGAYVGNRGYKAVFSPLGVTVLEGQDPTCPQQAALLRHASPLNEMIYGPKAVQGGDCSVSTDAFDATRIGMTLAEVRAVFKCGGAIADKPDGGVYHLATVTFGRQGGASATFRFDRDGKAVMRFYTP